MLNFLYEGSELELDSVEYGIRYGIWVGIEIEIGIQVEKESGRKEGDVHASVTSDLCLEDWISILFLYKIFVGRCM